MSTLNSGPVRVTTEPPEAVPRKTAISPAITASFTVAEYTGGLVLDDYTKFMATVTLYQSTDTENPVGGLDTASPNEWTTADVVHFTFANASIKRAGGYFLQVTVWYQNDMAYDVLGSAYTAGFWVI